MPLRKIRRGADNRLAEVDINSQTEEESSQTEDDAALTEEEKYFPMPSIEEKAAQREGAALTLPLLCLVPFAEWLQKFEK